MVGLDWLPIVFIFKPDKLKRYSYSILWPLYLDSVGFRILIFSIYGKLYFLDENNTNKRKLTLLFSQ